MDTPTKTDLLPCPFCGGEAHCDNYPGEGDYCVLCLTGECNGRMEGYQTKRAAIRAWNTRAPVEASHESGVDAEKFAAFEQILDRDPVDKPAIRELLKAGQVDVDSFGLSLEIAEAVFETIKPSQDMMISMDRHTGAKVVQAILMRQGYFDKPIAGETEPVIQFCDGPKKRYAEGLISIAGLREKVEGPPELPDRSDPEAVEKFKNDCAWWMERNRKFLYSQSHLGLPQIQEGEAQTILFERLDHWEDLPNDKVAVTGILAPPPPQSGLGDKTQKGEIK